MLLVIELKTEIVDVSNLLGTMDRGDAWRRVIARCGWRPAAVGDVGGLADSRRTGERLAPLERLRAKLPVDGRRIGRWLRDPSSRIDALEFPAISACHDRWRDLRPRRQGPRRSKPSRWLTRR